MKLRKVRLLRAGKMTFTTMCALGSCITLDNGFLNALNEGSSALRRMSMASGRYDD